MNVESFASARTETLREFLARGRLTIPDLQRPYAWSKDDAGELLADITQFIDHGGTDYYYLGSVVYYSHDQERVVVDGQQRLATITILLCAIRDEIDRQVRANDLDPQEETVRVLKEEHSLYDILHMIQNALKEKPLRGKPLLMLRGRDEKRLDYIQRPSNERPKTRPHGQGSPRLYRVFDFYAKEVHGLSSAELDPVAELATVLLERVAITRIEVEDLFAAYTIFSRLNNRGKDLSLSDLVRATMLSQWQQNRTSSERNANKLLEQLNKLEEIEYGEMPNFLRRYWILKTGKKHSPQATWEDILEKVEQLPTDKALLDMARDIGDAALAYRDYLTIVEKGGNTQLEKRLAVLHTGKLQQHLPMVIALLTRGDLKKAGRDGIALLDVVEAIHINHNVIGNQITADFEDLFAKAALVCNAGSLNDATRILVDGYEKLVLPDLRTREGFIKRLSEADISDSAAHLLLRRLEMTRWGGGEHVLGVERPKDVNLEHILPREPSGDWDKKWQDEDLLEAYVTRLGNLTLLSEPLNKGVKNRGFATKVEYYKGTDIRLTEEVAKLKKWDVPEIEARSAKLAEEAADLWSWSAHSSRRK